MKTEGNTVFIALTGGSASPNLASSIAFCMNSFSVLFPPYHNN
jgi:hypothetical protein